MSRGHRLALLVVLAAAAALRLPRLGRVPDGLIPDEALSAYDAFSILRTGRDQYGEPLPLFPRSTARLGCLYMYATVPAVAALGLTETAARLAAALAGTATVLVLFALVREGYGPTVGLIAAGLIAISPWHVLLSRTGFDWVLLPALVTFSLWLLVRCARGAGSWIAAGVASGLALYSYAPGRALMPVLLLAFGLLHGRSLATRWRGAALAGALFVVLAAPVAASMAAGGGLERLESIRDQSEAAPAARSFLARYAAAFSPSFLLHPARGPELHRMSSAGLLYGFELPLIVLGAVHVLRHRCRLGRLLLLWLLLAPLTVAIHRDSPDPILSSTSLPAPQALAAIGAGWLIEALRPAGRWRNAVLAAAAALIAWAAMRTARDLYTRYPADSAAGRTARARWCIASSSSAPMPTTWWSIGAESWSTASSSSIRATTRVPGRPKSPARPGGRTARASARTASGMRRSRASRAGTWSGPTSRAVRSCSRGSRPCTSPRCQTAGRRMRSTG